MTDAKNIALALSGGGIRAMVFHLGVLKFLSEQNKLEEITHISTVSGGSLVIGLLFKENQMQWPNSSQYNELLPSLRKKLCTKSLLGGMIRQLLNPKNWYFLLSRANLLAFALRDEWGIKDRLIDLPTFPEWSINGTTAETGKRFRFKQENFGDYVLGYASSKNFPLASALAVSAGFPGGIGPLVIKAESYEWKKRKAWGEPKENQSTIPPLYARFHVYDGGVYDNLGLEPFFNAGKGILKSSLPSDIQLILSDASTPLEKGFSLSKLNPWRLMRITDIIYNQSRALRIRTFVNYIKQDIARGNLISIFDKISDGDICSSSDFASKFPTTLRRLTYDEFDKLFNHGYEVAKRKLIE